MAHFTRGLRHLAFAISTCLASATPILAQEASTLHNDPTVFFVVHDGTPLRLAGGATVVLPFGKASSEDGWVNQRAVELHASGGLGGARLAGGMAFLAGSFGPDVLFSVTHTSASPRGTSPHATYAGLEAGYL